MAARGGGFEAEATACPFVALELDRDRRSERPDYRHRCYAEQRPAPRTIAHQERFCLSPNFSGCPIFQAWALRAAARPVPIPGGVAASARRDEPAHDAPAPDAPAADPPAYTAPAMAAAVSADEPPLPDVPPADDEPWPDSMGAPIVPEVAPLLTALPPPVEPGARAQTDTTWSAAVAGDPAVNDEVGEAQQRGAFDAPPKAPPGPPPGLEPLAPRPTFASTLPDEPLLPVAPEPQASPAYADEPGDPDGLDGNPPMPAFLTGRSARPRPAPMTDKVGRQDVVPSWEIDGRFGAEPSSRPPARMGGGGGGGMGNLLTAIAVVVIIGLGILAVLIIPGVLSGSPTATPRPTLRVTPLTSAQASTVAVLPTATAAAEATPTSDAQPTPEATPEPSPILYRIKRGDSLERIARRNGTTVQAILDANPQLPSADYIQVGQVIVLPPPSE